MDTYPLEIELSAGVSPAPESDALRAAETDWLTIAAGWDAGELSPVDTVRSATALARECSWAASDWAVRLWDPASPAWAAAWLDLSERVAAVAAAAGRAAMADAGLC